eukprot:1144283-Pyramimonas_sp.AAC.1
MLTGSEFGIDWWQVGVDPDEIFRWEGKTCSLEEVFARGSGKKPEQPQVNPSKRNLSKRNSSGNWVEDRL